MKLIHIFKDLKPGAQYDLRVLARTKQGWPNVTESQLKWTTVTMPPAESNQFVIKNIVDVQVLIVNTSIVKVNINFFLSYLILKKYLNFYISNVKIISGKMENKC